MNAKFHDEVEELKKEVLGMGDLAKKMFETAVDALTTQDGEKARWVISKKDKIREFDHGIEERALHLLILHQPVAKDLRAIACILKIITYLTRIGRYGKDIAQIELEINQKPYPCITIIPDMKKKTVSMIADALKAFETEDLSSIKDIGARDSEVDKMRYEVFRMSISTMESNNESISECSNYSMVARYIERCADHACKIAEKAQYMVIGEHVEIS